MRGRTARRAGVLPHRIIHADQSVSQWQQWAREGLMYDLGPLASKAEHPFVYSLINSEIFKPVKADGKPYFIAGTRHGQD